VQYGSASIHDPVEDRFVTFGGVYQDWTGAYPNADVWEVRLPGQTWSPITPAGPGPTARYDHSAVYDPARRRMIVFGGRQNPWTSTRFSDLWALELSGPPRWTALATGPGPEARYGHRAILDPIQDKMIVFGGRASAPLGDVWELDLATLQWAQSTPGGSAPSPRVWPSFVFDSRRERAILFGGQDASGATGDTWLLDLTGPMRWSELSTPVAPAPRFGHVAFYDEANDHMVVHAGGAVGYGWNFDDTWVLELEDAVDVPRDLLSRVQVSAVAPNPANHRSSLALELPVAAPVTVEIVDVAGRIVREVVRGPMTSGPHRFVWDGEDSDGRRAAPGLYFYRVLVGAERFARKLALTR
jgi:hypothetical protein